MAREILLSGLMENHNCEKHNKIVIFEEKKALKDEDGKKILDWIYRCVV